MTEDPPEAESCSQQLPANPRRGLGYYVNLGLQSGETANFRATAHVVPGGPKAGLGVGWGTGGGNHVVVAGFGQVRARHVSLTVNVLRTGLAGQPVAEGVGSGVGPTPSVDFCVDISDVALHGGNAQD